MANQSAKVKNDFINAMEGATNDNVNVRQASAMLLQDYNGEKGLPALYNVKSYVNTAEKGQPEKMKWVPTCLVISYNSTPTASRGTYSWEVRVGESCYEGNTLPEAFASAFQG